MKRLLSTILAIVMIVTVLPLSIFADNRTPATNASITTNSNRDEGVFLTKMATPRIGADGMPDGTIDITLEVYTTGVVTTSTKVVPADIVLVLDTSGSMEDGADTETIYTYYAKNGTEYTNWYWEGGLFDGQLVVEDVYGIESGTSYIKIGDEYIGVSEAGTDSNKFQYYSYRRSGTTHYVYPILDSDPAGVSRENNYSVVQFYGRTAESVVTTKNRMELLVEGVNDFINETLISNEGAENGADKHSISIIKFADDSYYSGFGSTQDVNSAVAGNNKNGSGYNYSQVVAPLTTVDETGAAELSELVGQLSPGGATSVDYGLALATKVLNDARNSTPNYNKNQVVVVFTDGEPNHSSGYSQSVAATCISQAKSLKDNGVTIFTICVADDADASATIPSSNTNINKFMHYLSSNFPNATVGRNNILDDGIADSEVAEAMSRGFYQTPSGEMGLGSIFAGIAQSIEKPSIEIGESATLIDTVSTCFTIPDGTNSIEVLTSDRTASGWADPVDASSSIALNIQNNRTVTVSGFDFDANYVSETPRDGFYGRKLILTFNITPDYAVLDNLAEEIALNGGKVSTNHGNASLNDSEMHAVAEVGSPTIQAYKVTYMVDGQEYKTVYRFAGADVTLIDEPADTAALAYGTWESEDVTISDNGFTMPAEDVVVSLTSTPIKYNVTYRYTGTIPDGTPDAPAAKEYANGTTVAVEAPVSVEGYIFSGWTTVSATVVNGEFTMPARDVEFIGYFSADTVVYTVEHYLQNADGTWPTAATTTHSHTGKTGETATAHTDIVYPNFTLDLEHEDTVKEGIIAADGSLVLKLFYARNQYEVKYEYIGTAPEEAPALPETVKYYYGSNVTLADVPSVPGYTFVGWATEDADAVIMEGTTGKYFTMPARNVTIKGTFVANTGTVYSVQHWLEGEDGTYTLRETTTHAGTTDTMAYAVPGNYASYSYYPTHSETVASGNIEGDGSLVLKLFYNRDPYKVTYKITGGYLPENVTIPAEQQYDWGTDVSVAEVLDSYGYVFYGWYTDDVTVTDGTFEMPAHNVEFTGYFIKETATYTIEHYLMDTEGNYPTEPTESYSRTGNVGDTVTAAYIQTFLNVVPDTDHADTVTEGVIVSNESPAGLVLKLYYERISSTVTYRYTGTVPDDAPALPEAKKYYAGAAVKVDGTPTLEGYTFIGWVSSDVTILGDVFTMPNKDVVITGYFKANTGTGYKVEHWVETSTGYVLGITTEHAGETDTTATAVPESLNGYEYNPDHPDNVVSGNIEGDGSLVLKLYYDRLSYKVTYTIVGDVIPEGVTAPAEKEYKWGTTVDVEDVYDITGYRFIGWSSSSATVENGKFKMPIGDVQFTGRFVIDTAEYTVEHYLQNTDGTWPTTPYNTHKHTGQIGTEVEAHTHVEYPNFTLDPKHPGTIFKGTIAADGSLVLKLFFTRAQYTVEYKYIGTVPAGAPALPETKYHYHNATVTLAPAPTLAGYTFVGWATDNADVIIRTNGNDKYIIMPARNVVISGTWLANDNTVYTVQHWLETEDGQYELEETTTRTGTTGTTVYAVPGNFIGYSHNPDHADRVESGVIAGDGSLVLKEYYDKTPYNVYYSISGTVPEGAIVPESQTHDYSDAVKVAPYTELYGYMFVGWTTSDVTITNDQFTMPANDVYLSGYYVQTIAGYKVEHYLQDTEGNWPETPETSYSIVGDIGTEVSADYLSYVGFTPDRNHEDTLLVGLVKEDGSLVLKLYYTRNKYNVTYEYTGVVPNNAPALPESGSYYYDSIVGTAGIPQLSGYTFYGWTTDDTDVVGQEFTMPEGDVKFTGYFVAGPSKYTVEHYLQNLDGTYNTTPDESEVFSEGVKVDDYVVARFKAFEGFTPDTTKEYSGTVTPEPDTLVIKLYYTRNSYNVYYSYFGLQPEGAPDVSVNNLVGVKYGEVVQIADIPTLTDHAFDGWHSTQASLNGDSFVMPARNVTLYGNFVLVRSTYRVEHYLQNLDGTWPETTSHFEIIGGQIGDTAEGVYKEFTGFTADEDNENAVTEGVINEDGTLVLKLYYERNKYKVTYTYESAPEGAPALPEDAYVYYGETVKVAADPVMDHHEFEGWTTTDVTVTGGEFTMPAKDVTIKGSFEQTEFMYKVLYYVNDELLETHEVYSGSTHTIIAKPKYPAPMMFKGWSEPINVTTGEIVPTSDGTFVMPESDVEIHGTVTVNLPGDGKIAIEKELEAPAGFNKMYFTFSIYRQYGSRNEFVKTVRVRAGERVYINLDPGIYYVYEEDAEVDGYTLHTETDAADNRVVVKSGRASTIKFKNTYYENILVMDDHFGYVIGYPDGLVRPEANITRAEVATIFFRMLTDEARATYWSQTNNFTDVSSSDWFNNAVSTLANAGVINGYEDGTFRPDAYITRAELVKIAVSFFGTSAGQSTHFADASSHWAADFVAAAEAFGFVDGYEDGTFRPDNLVTRAESMKIINRTLGRNPHKDQLTSGMITWADNTPDKWYYADVQEATNSHIYHWDANGFEVWEAILPVRDWAALEKEWSDSNDN